MKLRPILFGLLALAAVVGCQEETLEPKLNVSRTAAEAPADGGDVIVEVTSNLDWTASADVDWVTAISPSSGKPSDAAVSVFVTVAANESAEERSAVVTFAAGALTRTLSITQAPKASAPEDEPAEGQDSDLFVAWAFSSAIKTFNSATWHQSANDLAEGFADKYLSATKGSGKIQYYQVAKSSFEGKTDKIRRHTGNSAEPMAYGSWTGDYFLFEADCNLPANSNVSISFGIRGKANALLYWLLEYKDAGQWKPAGECDASLSALGINSNVVCGENKEETTTVVNRLVVLTQATDKVEFRLKCVSNISLAGNELTEPASDTYVRIAPEHKIIIKGGAITDADKESILSPSLALKGQDGKDISSASVEAEGGNVSLLVNSNMDWEAASDVAWASVIPFSGTASDSDASVAVTVEANTSETPRTAKITITAKYGNLTFTKELSVSQAGKTPEPAAGTESDLFVAWTFSDALNALHKSTFHQNEQNDKAAGDGGKYIDPAIGTGKFSYVQVDKSNVEGNKVYRHIHNSNYPMVYGVWPEDYFLFEATPASALGANSTVSISFHTYASNAQTLKYWMLEYLDGQAWKPAIASVTDEAATYNVAMKSGADNTQNVSALVVLENSCTKVSFRLRCVSNTTIGGSAATAAPESAIRIDARYPIIIKGSAIAESDIAGVLKPAIALDKEEASVAATGGEVALAVTSNMAWTAASDAAWATLSATSGEGAEAAANLKVTVAENTAAEARTATITVTGTYGNISLPKTLVITQEAKTAGSEPEPEPAFALHAEWDLETAEDNFNEASGQHTDAGDHGKYVNATTGSGKLTYVQVDKKDICGSNNVYRKYGTGDVMVYGAWEGDYFLFAAQSQTDIPAGTKISIAFSIRGSNGNAMRDWTLEYLDEGQWKTAISEFVMTTENQAVEATVTMNNAGKDAQFRLRCTSKRTIGTPDADATVVSKVAARIPRSIPIVIKTVSAE